MCSQHGLRHHRFSHLSGYFVAVTLKIQKRHTLPVSLFGRRCISRRISAALLRLNWTHLCKPWWLLMVCGDGSTDRGQQVGTMKWWRRCCRRSFPERPVFYEQYVLAPHVDVMWHLSLFRGLRMTRRSNKYRALHSAILRRSQETCRSSVHLYIDAEDRPRPTEADTSEVCRLFISPCCYVFCIKFTCHSLVKVK